MISEDKIKKEALYDIARKMVIAARTAPKGRGMDNIVIAIAETPEIENIAIRMEEIAAVSGMDAFRRDACNIRMAPLMLMIGAKYNTTHLPYCGLCGFENCENKSKHPESPCVFNIADLGIAVGSAVDMAAHFHADNRIMYTAGMAVKKLSLLGEDVQIVMCIPLSATSKNPFFDRK